MNCKDDYSRESPSTKSLDHLFSFWVAFRIDKLCKEAAGIREQGFPLEEWTSNNAVKNWATVVYSKVTRSTIPHVQLHQRLFGIGCYSASLLPLFTISTSADTTGCLVKWKLIGKFFQTNPTISINMSRGNFFSYANIFLPIALGEHKSCRSNSLWKQSKFHQLWALLVRLNVTSNSIIQDKNFFLWTEKVWRNPVRAIVCAISSLRLFPMTKKIITPLKSINTCTLGASDKQLLIGTCHEYYDTIMVIISVNCLLLNHHSTLLNIHLDSVFSRFLLVGRGI